MLIHDYTLAALENLQTGMCNELKQQNLKSTVAYIFIIVYVDL